METQQPPGETQQVPGASGLLGSLRGFADGVLGSVHDRIELLSVELQEEKHRLIGTLIWASAVVALALLAVIAASCALVVVFWDTARVPVVVGLAVAYGAGFIGAVLGFKRFMRRQPEPFAATLRELREDRTCVRMDN